jgi:hypothetical protein
MLQRSGDPGEHVGGWWSGLSGGSEPRASILRCSGCVGRFNWSCLQQGSTTRRVRGTCYQALTLKRKAAGPDMIVTLVV